MVRVLAVLAALVCLTACATRERPLLPGLVLGPEGQILAADAAGVRQERERAILQALGPLVSDRVVAVHILEDPLSFDRSDWFWESATVEIRVEGGEGPPPYLALATATRDLMAGWMRGGARPEIRFPGPSSP